MIFINPKTDFAFKKIFGSDQSQGILISFLNGILYAGQPTIQDLDILNPYQAPKILGAKNTYLDIKAKLATGDTVIIEMQVLNVAGFEKRILYNAAKAYSLQLKAGEDYPLLNPVIALTITDFILFPDLEAVLSRFILKEKQHLIDYPIDDLELVFVELPKFQQPLEQLQTLTDKWLYFLQHARDLSVVPTTMGDVVEIQQAFAMANQANLSPEELDELERQGIFIQDQRGAITKATQEGLEQGLQQGLQQGLEQGLQEGRQEAQVDIARRLLVVMEDGAIAELTGLALADIQALRRESG
jgi:predicted transposase/invertase (TIGR01784 family)